MTKKWDRINEVVPRGDGLCWRCTTPASGLNVMSGCESPCSGCHPMDGATQDRRAGICTRCKGTGTDPFGMHCGHCRSNHARMDYWWFMYDGVALAPLLNSDTA